MTDRERDAPVRVGLSIVIGPCEVGAGSLCAWPRSALPRWLRDAPPRATFAAHVRVALKVLAIAVCTAIVGLALPNFNTLDYWLAMGALLIALVLAGTM